MPYQADDHPWLQYSAVPHYGGKELPVGPVVRLGRLQPLWRPTLEASKHYSDGIPRRTTLRGCQCQGGVELPQHLS